MKRSSLPLVLISVMLVWAAQSRTLDAYCQAPNRLTVSKTQVSTSPIFDHVGTYLDDDGESSPLVVKNGGEGDDYQWASYDQDGEVLTATVCTGSETDHFVSLVGSHLFLNESAAYKVCEYNPTADSTKLDLPLVSGKVPTIFNPYMVDGDSIYVMVTVGTEAYVYTYTKSSGTYGAPTVSTAANAELVGVNEAIVYDKTNTKLWKLNAAGDAWDAVDTSGLGDAELNSVGQINFYPLVESHAVISTKSSNLKQGIVFSAIEKTITELGEIDSDSTIDILDFSDGFYNFVRVSSAEIQWVTLATGANPDLWYTELSPHDPPNGFSDVIFAGTSQNKLSLLTDYGELTVYKHLGDDDVEFVFSKTIPSTTIDQTTDFEYKLDWSCACQAIRRLTCFSQTLKCVVLNKAGTTCGGDGEDYTTWGQVSEA